VNRRVIFDIKVLVEFPNWKKYGKDSK